MIADARSRAAIESNNALKNVIDNVGTWKNAAYCPRYKEWFGDYDNSGHMLELRPGYSAVRDRLNDSPIIFQCGGDRCSDDIYAYVFPVQPYVIYLCKLFWGAPMTGTNSKMASHTFLLLHEFTEFFSELIISVVFSCTAGHYYSRDVTFQRYCRDGGCLL